MTEGADLNYNFQGQWSTTPYGWKEMTNTLMKKAEESMGVAGFSEEHDHGHGHGHSHDDHGHGHSHGGGGNCEDRCHTVVDLGPPPAGDYSNRIRILNMPLLGRLHLVRDKGGAIQVSFIVLYWIYGNFSTWNLVLLPHYHLAQIPLVVMLLYAAISALCIASLFRASTLNPGRIPYSEEKAPSPAGASDWTPCAVCRRTRPPKAHHCSKCKQCVQRMDHHCPWVNNCIGEENHFAFIQLIVYAFLLSFCTFILFMAQFYYFPPLSDADKTAYAFKHETFFSYLAVVLAVLMSTAAAGLVLTQHLGVVMNMTTIDWMKLQSSIRNSGVWPDEKDRPRQDRSCIASYRSLCGPGSILQWPFPCRRKKPSSAFDHPGLVI